ncbi:MAG: glutathione synthase [Coriobacteriia bacterium]|nr:glutathione synthase [Coriobacteriia bacterium]MBN2822537.1 glutathione synthase [Coriobacteriia bacterium]
MRIGLMVNDIATEEPGYSTTRIALSAINRGHEAWVMSAGDFAYDPDEKIRARARHAPNEKYKSGSTYLAGLRGPKAKVKRITIDDLDVLMLRSNPAEEGTKRPWAQSAGIEFGRIAMRNGVIVLNDPNGLAKAMNKMYFQLFPEEVRPRTLITRDREEIKEFVKNEGGRAVLKPLQGSGGQGVFMVDHASAKNVNQMVEALTRDGYVICQEYLEAAEEGDTRLFMMNGQPLRYKGHYAAFRRIRQGDDIRSNVHAGGAIAQAQISETHLRIAEMVRPKLVADGMFLVGLDIVGDKLMEINVFSPGGLGSAQKFEKVNFAHAVLDSLESKVEYMAYYRRRFSNTQLATL